MVGPPATLVSKQQLELLSRQAEVTALTSFGQSCWVPTWLFGPFFSYVRLWCLREQILLDTP